LDAEKKKRKEKKTLQNTVSSLLTTLAIKKGYREEKSSPTPSLAKAREAMSSHPQGTR
jgi:hypothetical protein